MNIPSRTPSTRIYQATEMPAALSPLEIYKDDPEIKKMLGIGKKFAPKPAVRKPENQTEDVSFPEEDYKRLTEAEKDQMCAAIVLSHHWRVFLKPYLEERTNPARKQVRSDEDYYQLLNDNAIAADRQGIIADLERRARRSPSYQFIPEEIQDTE